MSTICICVCHFIYLNTLANSARSIPFPFAQLFNLFNEPNACETAVKHAAIIYE